MTEVNLKLSCSAEKSVSVLSLSLDAREFHYNEVQEHFLNGFYKLSEQFRACPLCGKKLKGVEKVAGSGLHLRFFHD